MLNHEWAGDSPFCLVIRAQSSDTLIDVDRPGWLTEYAHLMRAPGTWILARKHGSVPVLQMHVAEGEQPYYTARVYGAFLPPIGAAGLTEIDLNSIREQAKIKVYGIGKKLLDGKVDRMWVLPTGVICGGDDDGPLADRLAKAKLAALLKERINGPDDGRSDPGEEADSGPAGEAGEAGGEGGGEEDAGGGRSGRPGRDPHRQGRGRRQANRPRGGGDQPGDGQHESGVRERP